MPAPFLTRAFAALCCLAGPFLPTAAAAGEAPGYVEVSAYALDDTRYEAWLNLRNDLRRDFDEICGNTFCEGEFSNIQPLRFNCSVHARSGRVGACAWVFAASNEDIDPLDGRIRIAQRGFWRCGVPLAHGTTIAQFVDALRVERPLYAMLPRSSRSIMDALVDCL